MGGGGSSMRTRAAEGGGARKRGASKSAREMTGGEDGERERIGLEETGFRTSARQRVDLRARNKAPHTAELPKENAPNVSRETIAGERPECFT